MTTLKQYEINRYSRILGYGAARGEVIVPNDDIVEAIDSSDEWIKQRTGIATRHRASENQSVADLAIGAAKDALKASGVTGEDIEAVIISTISHPYATPPWQPGRRRNRLQVPRIRHLRSVCRFLLRHRPGRRPRPRRHRKARAGHRR